MSLDVKIWESIIALWGDASTLNDPKYKLQTDFALTYLGKTIDNPTPKYTQIEVPFRDGVLDLTDALGGLHYGIRDVTMRFELMCHRWEFDLYRSQIWMALHGRSYVVILPDSPDVAWSGRMEVTDFIDNGTTATVYIVIHAQPYKIIPGSGQTLLDTSWIPNTGFGPAQITVPNDYPKHWFIFWADFQGQETFDLPLLIDGELYTVKEVGRGRYWSPDDFWLDPGQHTIGAKPVTGVGGNAANLEIDVLGGCL